MMRDEGVLTLLLLIGFSLSGCVDAGDATTDPALDADIAPGEEVASGPSSKGATSKDDEPESSEGSDENSTHSASDGQSEALGEGDGPGDAEGGNGTQEQSEPRIFDPALDRLLVEDYVLLPQEQPAWFNYTFTVDRDYDTLEALGAYPDIPLTWGASLDFKVMDPNGSVVIEYTEIDAHVGVVTYHGGSNTAMPLGYLHDPPKGTYKVSVEGAGISRFHLEMTGYRDMAPDFTFNELNGTGDYNLSEFRGQVVLVDLMATWCGPCQDAMPDLVAIKEEYGDLVEILTVNIDDENEGDEELEWYQEEFHVDWPIGFEVNDSATKSYGSGFIPTFAVVNQFGGLVYRQIGAIDPEKCRELIDQALESE